MEDQLDDMAIISGEKPVFDVKIDCWGKDGEPKTSEGETKEMRLVLAKDKKFFQRGLMEVTIGEETAIISMDAMLSCIYSVYDTQNPYKQFDPTLFRTQIFALVEDKHVEETKEAPAHITRDIKDISLSEYLITPEQFSECKRVRLSISVEGYEEEEKKDESIQEAEIIEQPEEQSNGKKK